MHFLKTYFYYLTSVLYNVEINLTINSRRRLPSLKYCNFKIFNNCSVSQCSQLLGLGTHRLLALQSPDTQATSTTLSLDGQPIFNRPNNEFGHLLLTGSMSRPRQQFVVPRYFYVQQCVRACVRARTPCVRCAALPLFFIYQRRTLLLSIHLRNVSVARFPVLRVTNTSLVPSFRKLPELGHGKLPFIYGSSGCFSFFPHLAFFVKIVFMYMQSWNQYSKMF